MPISTKRGPEDALDDPMFIMPSGRAVDPDVPDGISFVRLARRVGLRGEARHPRATRLHDLRHGFAERALIGAASSNRRDISRRMLALSTYLGHSGYRRHLLVPRSDTRPAQPDIGRNRRTP